MLFFILHHIHNDHCKMSIAYHLKEEGLVPLIYLFLLVKSQRACTWTLMTDFTQCHQLYVDYNTTHHESKEEVCVKPCKAYAQLWRLRKSKVAVDIYSIRVHSS